MNISLTCNAAESLQPATLEIRYPAVVNNSRDIFDPYFVALLKLGMEKSGRRYTLNALPLSTFMESRSEVSLGKNYYNLHWLNSTPQREANLVPIRIPLFKGLIGWRLLFIKAENQSKFSNVNTLEDLRQFSAGQGHDWPDVEIFKFNHLPVTTSVSWDGLFKMLHAGRIDYYPRSIVEIWQEQQQFPNMDLHIEDHLVLHYPAAYYFFTNRQNTEIAEVLSEGLERAIADGSFDKLFFQYYGEFIKKAALDKRKIIELQNPDLKIENPAYLYRPDGSSDQSKMK